MTVAALLSDGTRRLEEVLLARDPGATPALDAELLLAHALGVRRTRLRSHPDEIPAADAAARFRGPHRAPGCRRARRLHPWAQGFLDDRAQRQSRRSRPTSRNGTAGGAGAGAASGRRRGYRGSRAPARARLPWRWRAPARDGRSSLPTFPSTALAVARDNAAALGLTRVRDDPGRLARLSARPILPPAAEQPAVRSRGRSGAPQPGADARAAARAGGGRGWPGGPADRSSATRPSTSSPAAGCCSSMAPARPPRSRARLWHAASLKYARTAISPGASA